MSKHNVRNAGEKAAMGKVLAEVVQESFAKAGEKYVVALSGGSLPAVLNAGLADATMDWKRWHVFFADERMVPLDHKDSNYLACKEALFDKVGIPPAQVYPVRTDLTPDEAAAAYAEQIAAVAPNGFDLLLLGMGPDGHTCSLFPKHPLLGENSKAVASIADSPKPPPSRVTLTLPVIKAARGVVFVCGGAEKADPLRRAIVPAEGESPSETPARIVADVAQSVTWIVDDAAAAKL
eukprot:TRINITY_DN7029_c0_g1_i2.p1 TRINITY_DN7029_c0_g1~~TRINITY_DN7029_c0_g1_i2.p1  ORF type:complete len:236 (+),score=99.94 TRINITY_DN7029_c0_g1_i2:66-773(+)